MWRSKVGLSIASLVFCLSIASLVSSMVNPITALADCGDAYVAGCGVGPWCESDYGLCGTEEYAYCSVQACQSQYPYEMCCNNGAVNYCSSLC